MRLLRIIPLALLIALVASPAQAWMSPATVGGGVGGDSCARGSYVLRENAPLSGVCETWAGETQPDWDYTGDVLQGDASINMAANTPFAVSASVTEADTYYVAFIFKPTANTTTEELFLRITDLNGGVSGCLFGRVPTGEYRYMTDSGGGQYFTLTTGNTYYVKLKATKSTSTCEGWVSTTGTSGNWGDSLGVSSGSWSTFQMGRLYMSRASQDGSYIIDDIRMSADDINY